MITPSPHPALLAEFAAWQALVAAPASAPDWLDEELDAVLPPSRGVDHPEAPVR